MTRPPVPVPQRQAALIASTQRRVQMLETRLDAVAPASSGKSKVTFSDTAPENPVTGDVWFDTADGSQPFQWDGTEWAPYQWGSSALAANSVGTSQIATAAVGAPQIAAAAVGSSQVAPNAITAAKLAAGLIVAGIIDGTTVSAATFNGSRFNGTDFFIDGDGAFFYSGTPTAGNMIFSIAPGGGSDHFGNTFQHGIVYYGPDGSYVQLANSPFPGVVYSPASAASLTQPGFSSGATLNAGAGNEVVYTNVGSGKTGGNTSSVLQMLSAAADNSTPPVALFDFGNSIGLKVFGSGIQPTDPWNPMSLGNGWTSAGSPNFAPGYRRVSNDSIEIIGVFDGTSATDPRFFQLPSGYRPSPTAGQSPVCACTSTGGDAGFVQCNTDGTLTLAVSGYQKVWAVHGFVTFSYVFDPLDF